MANRQIHELTAASALDPLDRVLVSTNSANLTRSARLADLPVNIGSHTRKIREKLAEAVSVIDFGAVGDGLHDDAPAFQAAIDAHSAILVPAGRWRLGSVVSVPPRHRIEGAGRDVAVIVAESSQAFVFHRNDGAFQVDPTADNNWNRSTLRDLTVRMAVGGIRVFGHEFRCETVCFFGGSAAGPTDADGWCIDMVNANECHIVGINAGYGGGTGHWLGTNGVRWRATMDGVNFGDSLLAEISIKLGSANRTAILLDGHTATDAGHVCNNMVLQRIQVNAPEAGAGLVPLVGTTGIMVYNAARICLVDCNIEVVETAFEEFSQSTGGTAGACVGNSFIGCISHNCPTAYRDSNTLYPRSVIQRTFVGCDNLGPLPAGQVSGDSARAQDGDAFFQGAWIADADGLPAVQLRSPTRDILLLTGDYIGAEQLDADGHPRQHSPYHGLKIDMGSAQSARITRPVVHGVAHPDLAGQVLEDVRLELGNGPLDPAGELARVQINDPLMLTSRNALPPRPMDGLIHHAEAASALPSTGDWYLGPGLYAQVNGGEFPPVAVQRGAVAERERNGDFTVTQSDFGKFIRVNHASDRTVTVPAGLVAGGTGARRLWVIRQGTGRVSFAAGAGVNLRATAGELSIARQYQMVELLVCGNDEVYISHIMPDAIEPYEERLHWTAGNVVVPQSYLGKLVRVSNGGTAPVHVTIPTGLVPVGMEAVSLKVAKIGSADVEIRADAGMTLASPGGNPYVITQPNKVVSLIVSGSASSQPDTIYIVD
ncbi:MAG: glycosyl hydrolase family 28-related protein [Geminicoccaceae bacterium]